MKYNKITVLIMFTSLLMICSLSTISAANQIINPGDSGGISKGIEDTGIGETLFLNPGIYNQINKDINITINKSSRIQGIGSADNVIIDAQGLSNIFTINKSCNVTFINITFINGYNSNNGGAISTESGISANMTFINCIFINNTGQYGGAISNINGTINVNNSKFLNNTGQYGGAISNTNGTLNVNNSEFINNTAFAGGGIYTDTSQGKDYANAATFVTNSNFTNNTAQIGGGIRSALSNLTINNCNFVENKATNFNGGGISSGHFLNVTNSTFTKNEAVTGGAIRSNYNSSITGSTFINNHASDVGGAIINDNIKYQSIEGEIIYNYYYPPMFLSENYMTGNSAGVLGNVIYNNGSMGILNLTYLSNLTIITNTGEILNLYATLTDDMGNPITWQDISFYANGVFIENITSIEGYVNITYLVTEGPGSIIPVTGEYMGHEGFFIIINPGKLIMPNNILETGKPNPEENNTNTEPPVTSNPEQKNTNSESHATSNLEKNDNTNKTNNNPTAKAAMKNTGIPIITILLILLSLLSVGMSKKQK